MPCTQAPSPQALGLALARTALDTQPACGGCPPLCGGLPKNGTTAMAPPRGVPQLLHHVAYKSSCVGTHRPGREALEDHDAQTLRGSSTCTRLGTPAVHPTKRATPPHAIWWPRCSPVAVRQVSSKSSMCASHTRKVSRCACTEVTLAAATRSCPGGECVSVHRATIRRR